MKKTFIIALVLLPLLALAQKIEVYYGEPNRLDWASGLTQHYDKGYIIAGGFQDGNWESVKSWGNKTDCNLEHRWDNIIDFNPGVVAFQGAKTDSSGDLIIYGFIAIDGTLSWPFVAKFDPCGEQLWCKILDYSQEFEDGWAVDITINQNDDIIVLASLDSEEEIEKIHLICIDSEGNVLWKKPYASKLNYPWLDEVVVRSLQNINDEYYISGYCFYPYPGDTTHFYLRPFFLGIDSAFNEKWILPFAVNDSIHGEAYSTIALNDSVYMGVGHRRGVFNKNSLLMFYNKHGEVLGYHQITNGDFGSNVDFNAISEVKPINDSMFISPFYTGIDGETYYGEIVYDTSGTILKKVTRNTYRGNSSIIKSSDDNYVIAIEVDEAMPDAPKTYYDILVYKIDQNLDPVTFDTTTYVYDSLCPGGVQSGTIDLSDCLVWTGIEDTPTPAQYYESIRWIPITAYPNPVTEGKLTLEFENTDHHSNMELRCYDDFGRQIHSQKIYKGQQDTDVDVTGWPPGIYLVVVYSDGSARGKAKFVVR